MIAPVTRDLLSRAQSRKIEMRYSVLVLSVIGLRPCPQNRARHPHPQRRPVLSLPRHQRPAQPQLSPWKQARLGLNRASRNHPHCRFWCLRWPTSLPRARRNPRRHRVQWPRASPRSSRKPVFRGERCCGCNMRTGSTWASLCSMSWWSPIWLAPG